MDDEALELTMQAIEHYLKQHPDGADTLAGIHTVWIQSQELPAVTRLALERLLARGVLESLSYGRDQLVWRRRRARAAADADADDD